MARSDRSQDNRNLQSADVPDHTVSQVGKAVSELLKLRQSLEENMATTRTDEERQNLEEQAKDVAIRVISDQGLTVAEYDEVIAAAQSDPDLEARLLTACRSA
jgi:hypothetical protein